MGRTKGRFFTTRFERDRQDQLIRQQQGKFGTSVTWFFLSGATLDSVFDEPDVMGGRIFTQAARVIPVLSAVPLEGPNVPGDAGRYVTNRVVLRMSLRQVMAAGLPDLSREFEARYGDRFFLRGLVYDVTAIATEGNFDATNEDVVIRVEGRQLRADELTTDPGFAQYVNQTESTPQLPTGTPPVPQPQGTGAVDVYVGDDPPPNPLTRPYVWIDTDENGDFTLWLEDGS